MAIATKLNGAAVVYGVINGFSGFQDVSHAALYDAASAGNLWFVGELDVVRRVYGGDTFTIAIGALKFTLTGINGAVISDGVALGTLDAWLGSTVLGPVNYWVALMTAAPDSDGTGGTEFTGGSYSRIALNNDASSFPAASMV